MGESNGRCLSNRCHGKDLKDSAAGKEKARRGGKTLGKAGRGKDMVNKFGHQLRACKGRIIKGEGEGIAEVGMAMIGGKPRLSGQWRQQVKGRGARWASV